MQNKIQNESRSLTEKLLSYLSNQKNPSPINIEHCDYADKGTIPEICYKNPQSIDLLVNKEVIRVINIPKRDERPAGRLRYKISFRRDKAEKFLNYIVCGDFIWERDKCMWRYKDQECNLKQGSGYYKLIDLFMLNPNVRFSKEEIIDAYGIERIGDSGKYQDNYLISEIKKKLDFPPEHFVAGDGYKFIPNPKETPKKPQ